jgi:hypothetical protein
MREIAARGSSRRRRARSWAVRRHRRCTRSPSWGKHARINDLSGTITFDSGISAKIGDLGLMDSLEGTYVLK